MTPAEMVDKALDQLFRADPRLVEFDRSMIAAAIPTSKAYASWLLQQHRIAQRYGKTRYVVAARGYARAARWYVLAAPGKGSTRARRRLTLGHVSYISADFARRAISDLKCEVDPATVHHPTVAAFIAQAETNLKAQIGTTLNSIKAVIELTEQVTGEKANRVQEKAVDLR